ncbi:histidinol-phosphate transaminase [Succinimonas amylolytica]|uniref:histidinol-phosphate transaminase n=1 Tax=Succinimonas amylolytica TaxID=83769 RepID=UPI00035FF902|nr:histidinol-phosphate transaminase [Succinimonas amylolytica]
MSSDDISLLATKRVRGLTPYLSARRIGGQGHTFLNANEAPSASAFLMSSQKLNRYPDCQPAEVLEAYAAYAGVSPENVLVSRGSDEVIGLLIRTFCEPDEDSIIICPPTYGMYRVSADTNGARVLEIPPREDFSPDAAAIAKALAAPENRVKLVFLCSPNNPTGDTVKREDLLEILEAARGRAIVVADEAYIEFCPEDTFADLLPANPHLVITRTLSKAFGLAGIRCGFALGNPEVLKLLLKVIDPYPICDPVAQIAVQALSKNGIEIMKARVRELNARKESFIKEVSQLSRTEEVFGTKPNYVLFRFRDGEEVFREFARRGVILRDFNDKPRLRDCIRITIGSEQEMQEVLRILKELDK